MLIIGVDQMRSANDQQVAAALDDTTAIIQQELVTARSVHDGYTRTFSLPKTIVKQTYTIENASAAAYTVFTITTPRNQLSVNTPPCIGSLQPGTNTITKKNNTLWCNP